MRKRSGANLTPLPSLPNLKNTHTPTNLRNQDSSLGPILSPKTRYIKRVILEPSKFLGHGP
jgi:hypothetical protein